MAFWGVPEFAWDVAGVLVFWLWFSGFFSSLSFYVL